MRIVARSTLREFWINNPSAEQPLKSWFKFVSGADWNTPSDVKEDYRNVSFLAENRICFNIGGNKFRLVVRINYPFRVVYIRFIGTHNEYGLIDANTI